MTPREEFHLVCELAEKMDVIRRWSKELKPNTQLLLRPDDVAWPDLFQPPPPAFRARGSFLLQSYMGEEE